MKNPGTVALIETVAGKEPVEPKSGKLPAGYCTIDFLEKQLKIVFERVLETRVNAEKSQSVGVLVIYNLKETDARFDQICKNFLELAKKLESGHT